MTQTVGERLFEAVTEDREVDSGLSDRAEAEEPGNFLRHVLALSASKIADGLIDPKLVLSWLLQHLGAGAFWVGLLVPVRESLALLPQIFTTPVITRARQRRWFWAGGAIVQGIAAAGIALVALTLEGAAAGAAIVGCLAVLALARSICSASYKDILGKTVGKAHRGTATGTASSAASLGVILFAGLLLLGWGERFTVVIAAICLAAGFWIAGGAVLATLREAPSDPDDSRQPLSAIRAAWGEDPQLRRFVAVRALLVGTALAPPYLVLLAPDSGWGQLGALVLASAVASLLSSYVWGRLSDRSSRRVLLYAGLSGGAVLSAVLLAALTGLIGAPLVLPVLLFGLMIAYHGVRQGRSTHLVDMAGEGERARYTALSNTLVGIVLIVMGGLAAGLAALAVPLVIGLFAAMCFAAAWSARELDEVQT